MVRHHQQISGQLFPAMLDQPLFGGGFDVTGNKDAAAGTLDGQNAGGIVAGPFRRVIRMQDTKQDAVPEPFRTREALFGTLFDPSIWLSAEEFRYRETACQTEKSPLVIIIPVAQYNRIYLFYSLIFEKRDQHDGAGIEGWGVFEIGRASCRERV